MLSKFKVQRYKSLFDTEIDLEPLTVFIGPNGSGKSNICEAIVVFSDFLKRIEFYYKNRNQYDEEESLLYFFSKSFNKVSENKHRLKSKFWHGECNYIQFKAITDSREFSEHQNSVDFHHLQISLYYSQRQIQLEKDPINKVIAKDILPLKEFLIDNNYFNSSLFNSLKEVATYDFIPTYLSNNSNAGSKNVSKTGKGIAYALLNILLSNRKSFDELEERFILLIPNIKRIVLLLHNDDSPFPNDYFTLELIDKYSDHQIPSTEISDGTLRILGFLTALYQKETPSIICFEELENGVHPWLLHKMMELLKIISTEGINGKPVQVLITTHSPLLLNYVEPYQVRAVELDGEGKTQVHKLPIDSVRFQKALEAYDGELGELWFTNVFGGNPT